MAQGAFQGRGRLRGGGHSGRLGHSREWQYRLSRDTRANDCAVEADSLKICNISALNFEVIKCGGMEKTEELIIRAMYASGNSVSRRGLVVRANVGTGVAEHIRAKR